MTRVRRISRATFTSLHNRNYRLYFTGQIISVSGTWMQRFAQAWLILGLTNNNGVALGVEAGLQFLPMLLFGAWGGVIADRFDKRRLLYATQVSAGLLAFGLGAVVAFGTPTVAIVYVFSVLLGFVNVFDNPARQTFVHGDGRARGTPECGRPQQRRDEQFACRRSRSRRPRDRRRSASRRASSSTRRRTSR